MQYITIKKALYEQIEAGILQPGFRLPAERQLAELFSTTRVTLREALALLEADGVIYREDRRGWFVSPSPLIYDPSKPISLRELADRQNRKVKTVVTEAKKMLADKAATLLLALPPMQEIFRIQRLHELDGRPVCTVTHYIRKDVFPGLLDLDLTQPLGEIFDTHFDVTYASTRYTIANTSLIEETAASLHATDGTPAMRIQRINTDQQGRIVEAAVEHWRHDAISVESVADFM
ncbi:UTRA domain-containing protein [Parasalinivibrio latis]|uniref:UTRA domain-containing protein n=1 Tax=Parasalinivibrio latis TaxID=2952610 RepID=UPI0030E2FA01